MKTRANSIFLGIFLLSITSSFAQNSDTSENKQGIFLNEIVISASQASEDAPLTLRTINSREINGYLANKSYPEMLRNIGGVYATSESGSYGDAKVNIRGFKQENITVMLNGIPLSGFRSGSMFWNNWLGLASATHRVQLQKGIGGSMLAANSIGGTINIITKPISQSADGNILFDVTDYGQYKLGFSISSGLTKSGWAVSFVGSHTWGKGYVDATDVESWAYFLNVAKTINKRHSLLFTALGSPERHEQRSQKLSSDEVDKYGLRYNKNWGYHNEKVNNVSKNFYHKPYLSLTHFFNISEKALWSNSLFFSEGNGGGKWTETTGKRITSYLNAAGQIDWDTVEFDNLHNKDSVLLPDGSYREGYANNIQSEYLAGHIMAGLKSSLDIQYNERLKFSTGLHYQYFYSWQHERITDLLGGKFWYENYENNSLAGFAGRTPIKTTGDDIRLENGDRDNHFSAYAQTDYSFGKLQSFVGAMLMANLYQHWDKYNYPNNMYSECVLGVGGNVKAGASVKLGKHQQVYLNGAYYSRVPYNNVYFASNTNDITSDVRNEKNYTAEIGYKLEMPSTKINVNAYHSYWKNKALISDPYKPFSDEQVRYMINGLDARHVGIELTYDQRIVYWLSLSAFVSWGDWQWKNDVNATIYDPYTNLVVDTLRVYADGLFVGDAPQTQMGIVVTARIANALELRIENRYNDRMYANFDPSTRTGKTDRSQPYRMRPTFVSDIHVNYAFRFGGIHSSVFFTCNNLLNVHYIERGDDGVNHDLATFRGFWAIGRTMQVGIRMRF